MGKNGKAASEHILLEINRHSLTGVCKKCGPVEIYVFRSTRQATCKVGHNDRQVKSGGHGLTLRQAREYREFVGACEICNRDEHLTVDHNHETGQLRGVLCTWCNRIIGELQEDPARFQAMIEYLEYWRNKEG